MSYEALLTHGPFSLPDPEKRSRLQAAIAEAFAHHLEASPAYHRFCQKRGFVTCPHSFDYAEFPYLPVAIFKHQLLQSVGSAEVVRTVQSSATTSQTPSTIVLDNLTRQRQVRTMLWLLADLLGPARRPFVVFEAAPTIGGARDPVVTARAAALRGFLLAASSTTYGLRLEAGQPRLDREALAQALAAPTQRLVLLGYTSVLYLQVAKPLAEAGRRFTLPQATILHFGGWKTLRDEAVSAEQFRATLHEVFGVPPAQIIDLYGFTEHLGLIYGDGPDGLMRCPLVSEIIVRDPRTLEPVPDGQVGLVEFLTPLPHSYPGLAILLDDLGRIVTRSPGPGGRHGTAFEILGRAPAAELRGCGDVLAELMAQRA